MHDALEDYFDINEGSVSSPEMQWCALKAYIRGILLQIIAREKRKHHKVFHKSLADLTLADEELKNSPTNDNKAKFSAIQEKLRYFYLQDYEQSLKWFKLNFYSHGGRAGKFLANRVKAL